MKPLAYGVAALIIGSATYANAADMAPVEPPIEAPITEVSGIYDWNGFYVGANVGYGWTGAEFSAPGISRDRSLDGALVGLHAGYNFQNGPYVAGIEADVKHDFNEERFGIAGTPIEAQTEWGGSVRARLGYAIDRTLIFGTGGWAFSNAEIRNPVSGAERSKTLNGWTIGAGVEHAFTDNMTGRVEYRYTDFQDWNVAGGNADFDKNEVLVGVSWKF